MGLVAAWREAEAHRQRVASYAGLLLEEPAAADVAWLASVTGDLSRARHELRLLRCALGVMVAEQDALADRTAADVIYHLGLPIRMGQPEARAGWAERWRHYTDALGRRGTREEASVRLARVLFASVDVGTPAEEELRVAAARITHLRGVLNDALRSVFGQVTLPDDLPPSAIRR